MGTNNDILDNIELRSESVQDVLSEPPHWIFRWGNTIVSMILLMLLLLSYVIKYPEFIPAPIIITTQNPPEKLKARISSKVEKILIKDHQVVQKNEILMILQSTANYRDVLSLKTIIDSISIVRLSEFPINQTSHYKLGELQGEYNAFAKALQDENIFKKLQPYTPESIATSQSIIETKARMLTLRDQKSIEITKYELSKKNYLRLENLYKQGVIPLMELENEKIKYLQAKQNLQNVNISISQLEESLSNLNKIKSGTVINSEKDKINLSSQTLQLFEQLRKFLRQWEQTYLLISSVDGIVSFQQYYGENQFVENGDPILTIIPKNKNVLVGRMSVPAINSGKIISGEKVLIKLDNYRFQEYGIVTGKVQNISLSPNDGGNYYVDVILPNGLLTTHNRTLVFDKELKGNAEIVTEDLRLIDRFFYQIRKLLKFQ